MLELCSPRFFPLSLWQTVEELEARSAALQAEQAKMAEMNSAQSVGLEASHAYSGGMLSLFVGGRSLAGSRPTRVLF